MVTTPEDNGMRVMPSLDHLHVRRARIEDAPVIAAFSAAMALETEGRHLDRERLHDGTMALLQSPARGFFMVAELKQNSNCQLVGQLMITYEWSDWRNGAFWWIQSVYVAPDWRRQGVYRTMHQHVLREAKVRKDVCGVRLYVEQGNQVAQQVYHQVGLSPSSYQVFEEDFVLAKQSGATKL